LADYEQILVAAELSRAKLSRSVQRPGGLPLRRRETTGELVRTLVAQRGARRPEDLISQEPARHEVRVESEGRSCRAG
jgi:hypothetical protein